MNKTIFCIIGKRGAGKDYLMSHLDIPHITISTVLTEYCKENGIIPNRENLIQLGNTIFDGATLAQKISENLPKGGVITGLRKPETLFHLMRHNTCILIGLFADNKTRWQRVNTRNRSGDNILGYEDFLEDERKENSPPNKQNIDLLLSLCDYSIENNGSIQDTIIEIEKILQKNLPIRSFN